MSLTKKLVNTKKTCKVTFKVSETIAKNSEFVSIVGEFNNWNFDNAEMSKLKNGSFEKTIELPVGDTYQFRYRTSEGYWFNDEAADNYINAPFAGTHNSVLDLTEFKTEEVIVKKTAAKKEVKPTVAKTEVKETKTAKAKETKIDLTKIEGVGPKIAKLLIEKGLNTFELISTSKVETLQEVLNAAGSKFAMHKPDSWPAQAKLAASNKWEDLKKMQDKLKEGK